MASCALQQFLTASHKSKKASDPAELEQGSPLPRPVISMSRFEDSPLAACLYMVGGHVKHWGSSAEKGRFLQATINVYAYLGTLCSGFDLLPGSLG
jgi:hypothetical protein